MFVVKPVRAVPVMRQFGERTVVVPLTLDLAMEFSEGLALVVDEHGKRLIDTEGKTVITLSDPASDVGRFSEGLAAVRTTKTTACYRRGDTWRMDTATGL